MAERGKHLKANVVQDFARCLSVADAGLLLHVIDCPRCAAIARKVLAVKPVRRRRAVPPQGEGAP